VKQLLLIESDSEAETADIAGELASVLKAGDVVAIYGPLGAGKTAFVRGLAAGLGARGPVRSPTFSLINEYRGRPPLIHIDFYRLSNKSEIDDLGWTDYLNSDCVVAIEWAERVQESLPSKRFEVHISFGGSEIRIVEVLAVGNPGDR
jgi:tRNA threonylcarbamoyladenosine biosynthesis protein TsaE